MDSISKSDLSLEYVHPALVSPQDFAWLQLADQVSPEFHKIPFEQLVAWVMDETLMLFRFTKGQGVLLTEVVKGPNGRKRLRLVRAAGKDAALNFPEVGRLLQHTAREWGCEAIETLVYNPKLAKALERSGARQEAVNMVMEA